MWLLYMPVIYSFLRILTLVYIIRKKKNVLSISLKDVFICVLNILDDITIFYYFPL